jgi:hypothetical protein
VDWDWERTLPTDDFREREKPLRSMDGDRFFLAFLPVMLEALMMLAESERSSSDSVECVAIDDGIVAVDGGEEDGEAVRVASMLGRALDVVAGVDVVDSCEAAVPRRLALERRSMLSMVNGEAIVAPGGGDRC